eukprot:02553.XXX_24522_24198_1 [CDS] Oithona nana genome sequencing.
MRTSLVTLGKKWGGLAVIRGTTKYHISPFEQKAFAGAISKGVPNTLWRFRTNVLYWAPPFLITYLIYHAVEAEHDRLQRKQPGEFDHET